VLVIRDEQLAALEGVAVRAFALRLSEALAPELPELPRVQRVRWTRRAVELGREHGLRRKAHYLRLARCVIAWTGEVPPWAEEVLAGGLLSAGAKLERLEAGEEA